MARKSSTAGTSGPVNAFVLAGGQSRRMGRDKANLQWQNQTLLQRSVNLLSGVSKSVRIVGRSEFPDRVPGLGPLGGILTALEITDTDWNLILGVDLPLMTPRFLGFLRQRSIASGKDLVVCHVDGKYPLCLAIRRALLPAVADRVAMSKLAVQDLIEVCDKEVLDSQEMAQHGFDAAIFSNINTPEDWDRLQGA